MSLNQSTWTLLEEIPEVAAHLFPAPQSPDCTAEQTLQGKSPHPAPTLHPDLRLYATCAALPSACVLALRPSCAIESTLSPCSPCPRAPLSIPPVAPLQTPEPGCPSARYSVCPGSPPSRWIPAPGLERLCRSPALTAPGASAGSRPGDGRGWQRHSCSQATCSKVK